MKNPTRPGKSTISTVDCRQCRMRVRMHQSILAPRAYPLRGYVYARTCDNGDNPLRGKNGVNAAARR